MNKLLNNLENKLKDIEQDIKSLHALKDNQLNTDDKIVDIDELIEAKENERDEIKNDLFQLRAFSSGFFD